VEPHRFSASISVTVPVNHQTPKFKKSRHNYALHYNWFLHLIKSCKPIKVWVHIHFVLHSIWRYCGFLCLAYVVKTYWDLFKADCGIFLRTKIWGITKRCCCDLCIWEKSWNIFLFAIERNPGDSESFCSGQLEVT